MNESMHPEIHPYVVLSVGFQVQDLSQEAIHHKHTSEFKRATTTLLEREFGRDKLLQMSSGSEESMGEGKHPDMVRVANRHLAECATPMTSSRIVGHGCTYIPPNSWRIWSQATIHKDGLPLMAQDAVDEYDAERQAGGAAPLDEALRNELNAMPFLLQLNYDLEMVSSPAK